MAKMKAEVTHEYHQRNGASLRDRLFANIHDLSRLGSSLAPVSNLGTKLPGARWAMEKAVGIAADRTLPEFHRRSLREWFEDRGGTAVPESEAERRVVLFPDTHTTYNRPDIGRAAVRVLEAANVHVSLPEVEGSGRPPLSKGFIDQARETAARNVRALAPAVRDGWDVVVVEPSDAVMLQSDYLDLLEGEDAEAVAASSYGVLEYVDALRLDEELSFETPAESLTYHGHCHQKAVKKDHHAVGVLRRAGYEVDPLDSGCCGMAGSFGYESEHFSMSKSIGRILFEQVEGSDGDTVVAPGASCRTQLGDREGADGEPPHPIQKVAEALAS
jgi:Fe-S oxidoreductase